jgi:hypothetical protein
VDPEECEFLDSRLVINSNGLAPLFHLPPHLTVRYSDLLNHTELWNGKRVLTH